MNKLFETVDNAIKESDVINSYRITYYNNAGDKITYEEMSKDEAIERFDNLVDNYREYGSRVVDLIELSDGEGDIIKSANAPWGLNEGLEENTDPINWDWGYEAFSYYNAATEQKENVPKDVKICGLNDEIHLNGNTYIKHSDGWYCSPAQEHVINDHIYSDEDIQKIVDKVYNYYNGEMPIHPNKRDVNESENLVESKRYKCIKGMSHPNMGEMFKKGSTYELAKENGSTITLGGWNIDKKYLDSHFEQVENLKEEVLSDDIITELENIQNRIHDLQSTIKHTIVDEIDSINNDIEEINNKTSLNLDIINENPYYNTSDIDSDIAYEIKNSEWSKEEANGMDEAEHYSISKSFGDRVYESINRMSPEYSKIVSYLVKQGYGNRGQVRELMRDSAFFTDDLSDEELHTIASIVELKESDNDQDVDSYINLFRNILKQKDSSSFERSFNSAMMKLRELPSEGLLNADLYYAGLKAHAEEGTYGACMKILNFLKDIKANQEQ